MSLIKCKECGKEISDQAKSCPFCGYEADAPQKLLCPECRIEPVAITKKNSISGGGILGALLFLIALPAFYYNVIAGGIIIIIAILFGMVGRGSYTILKCPKCGMKLKELT